MILSNFKSTYLCWFLLLNFQLISCAQKPKMALKQVKKVEKQQISLKTGAERTALYLSKLKGKNVAIVANQTSVLTDFTACRSCSECYGKQKSYAAFS